MKQKFPYAIFDMDGTLVDSMPCWYSLHGDYARIQCPDLSLGAIKEIEEAWGFRDIFAAFDKFGVPYTREGYFKHIEDRMGYFYENVIAPKPKTLSLLEQLKADGCRMCVITMTPHKGADLCLAKTSLGRYFDFVLTREDTPAYTGKENPLIFEMALARLGCENPADCVFYEDSLYAIETAHKMGFYIRAVEDRWDEETQAQIAARADEIISLGYNL